MGATRVPAPPLKILHLEDNAADAELARALIVAEWPDSEIKVVATRFAYTGQLQLGRYDLILSDLNLGDFDGLDALRIARDRAPDTPFIFLSGAIGEDTGIDAVRAGAHDYVLKDRMKRLIASIRRALRESEERKNRQVAERRIRDLAEMVNQAREAIIITDLAGAVISWNPGAERLLGWRSDEVVGRNYEQLFKPAAEEQLRSARLEASAKGEWTGELNLHTKPGEALVVESRHTIVRDESGQPKARLSSYSDITDRKRLEEHFLRAQRIENIGLLAAGIAHDLNNVLSPMLMAAPLLREWVKEPAGLEILEMLEKSAERGSGLVRQILSFTLGPSGETRPVQIRDLMRDLVVVISSTFPKVIRLEEAVPPDLWLVKASPIQVHQVLLNLCVNARDAMPQGGILRLRAENSHLTPAAAALIDGAYPGAFVVLHVEDTGTGIPASVLAHMWEPFYTTKESGKGSGLGLSTVRGIMKTHRGFIQVLTQTGRGTSFRIYFPVAQTPGADSSPPAAPPLPRGHGELILIVEDEADIREMTGAMLSRQGYRVIGASEGSEAIQLFSQHRAEIRLVISDLHMPGIDGMILGRMLHRINPAVRFLVVSGSSVGAAQPLDLLPREFGAGFLSKPFKLGTLLNKVEEMLHQPKPHPSGVR